MKRLLFTFCFFLLAMSAQAQKENNNWTFGINYGLSFNTTPPSSLASNIVTHMSAPCAASDTAGNLLFYTDGEKVWDRNHSLMPNGSKIIFGRTDKMCMQDSTDVTNVSIIPVPGNRYLYYIIGSVGNWVYDGVGGCEQFSDAKYCMVDMSLNGGLGDVVASSKNTLLYSRVYGNIATGEGRCNKWLLLTSPKSEVLAFEISTAGINTTPRISSMGFPPDCINTMKTSNDNSKLAVKSIWKNEEVTNLFLFDFDVQTGAVSNKRFIDSAGKSTRGGPDFLAACAFSQDNSKFYYWGQYNEVHEIRQADLSNPSHSAILASRTKVYTITKYLHSTDMMLAPDGKIYQAFRQDGDWLVINRPDRLGTACDPKVVRIPPPQKISTYSLVGFQNWIPGSGVHYSYSDFASCAAPLMLSSKQAFADNYIWSTGATTRDITIMKGGTYWVKASQNCGAYRVDTFHVNFDPVRPVADTFSCNGEPITVPTAPAATYTWGSNGGPVITKSGTYIVKISVPGCGTINSSFKAIIYPPAGTPLLPHDTVICNAAAKAELNSYHEMGQYLWSNGATTPAMTVTQPGRYWLTSNTPCGLFADTANVTYCKPKVKDLHWPDAVCKGSCIDISAQVENYPQAYSWGIPAGGRIAGSQKEGQTVRVCFELEGTHQLSLGVGSPGGEDVLSKNITILPKPIARFDDTAVTTGYKTLLLLPTCGNAEKVNWYKDKELVCENCKQLEIEARLWKNQYRCIIQNGECMDTCDYEVEVTDIPTDVWLPSAFTPNGDGKNDLFRPLYDNPNVQIMSLSVYNRQGVRVYRSSDDGSNGWNGRYGSTEQSMGTYFWMLKYKVLGRPNIFTIKGDVTLVR